MNTPTVIISDDSIVFKLNDGTIEYRNSDGLLHRLNGPAVIYPDGLSEWYRNGKKLNYTIEGFDVPVNSIVGIDSMKSINSDD